MKKINIALVVGHSSKKEKGAYSTYLKTTEFDYWHKVTDILKNKIVRNIDVCQIFSHDIDNYFARQKYLSEKINQSKVKYDLVLEFHFNSSNREEANGTECLYWYSSEKGKSIAKHLSNYISKMMGTNLHSGNGLVPIQSKTERGYWFLKMLNAPAIIVESFFGSNKADCEKFRDVNKVAKTIADAISTIDIKDENSIYYS